MPEEVISKFKCSICGKIFKHKRRERAMGLARECEKSHDIIMVPMLKSDVQRLLAFLVTKDEELLTTTLWNTLRQYRSLV